MVFGIVFTHKKTNVTRDKMTPPSKCLSVVVKRPGILISRSVATVLSCKANARSSLLGLSWVLLIISLESIKKVIGSSALLSFIVVAAQTSSSILVSFPLAYFCYAPTKEIDGHAAESKRKNKNTG
jgi:hypothetical protein